MISFDQPYGFVGCCGCSSEIGTVSGSPYVAQLDENMNRLTPASRNAPINAMPCATLFSKYDAGCATDSPTYANAAKCTHSVIPCLRMIALTSARSPTSPW